MIDVAERFRSASPAAITATVIAVVGGLLLLAEWLAPLRVSVESKLRRVVRNVTAGGLSLAVVTLLQAPLLQPVGSWIVSHHVGLLQAVHWPRWIETIVAIVLLDYVLWWWHWATHRVPFLWRFHVVHHVDRDLDASTALRFHFVELALSILLRAAEMIVLGIDPRTLWLYQTILFASILFHHSNVRLPARVDRMLARVFVTPRMHGIHHSDREEETHSNWSSLLSMWDFLHRTARLDVPQERVAIGVPAYREDEDVTIGKILLMPFRRQRDDWRTAGSVAAADSVPSPHRDEASAGRGD